MAPLRWRAFLAVGALLLIVGLVVWEVVSAHGATGAVSPIGLVAILVGALGGAWLVAAWLAHSVGEPLQRLTKMAERMSQGDLGVRVHDVPPGVTHRLAEELNAAAEHLQGQLAQAHARGRHYAAILQQMTDAVVAVDDRGRVEFVNRTFANLFDVASGEAAGRPLENVTLNYDLSALVSRALEQGTVQRDRLRLSHPQERLLEAVCSPLTDGGEVIGAVGLLHDITELREVNRVRQDFVANASHELRTPAAGIKALAEALQAGAADDPQRGPKFCQQIVEAADRLTEILDDMLTLTRVERGASLLEPRSLQAADAVDEALSQVRPAARAKDIEVTADIRDGDRIFADAESLQTLLVNLLDNAVKYTPEGGSVMVRGHRVPGGYELAVVDTGVGIPREEQERIFERFYRVDRARDRATGSTGLGLSIVRHIAEAHGGHVSVTSAPDEGATFTAFFPALQGDSDAQ
ncbi:MAG: ATP-binding protein [Armatimonadota bacterium]|nr:ATP-binding protein [Armatimonadota bacterium]